MHIYICGGVINKLSMLNITVYTYSTGILVTMYVYAGVIRVTHYSVRCPLRSCVLHVLYVLRG